MHIIILIIFFIIGSIGAATKGDFSGIEVVAKVLLAIGSVLLIGLLVQNPAYLILVIIIVIVISIKLK